MNSLHVCHVVLSLEVGGLERNVLNQVRLAPGLGERCTVICLERPGELAAQAEAMGARVVCPGKRAGLRPGLVGQLRRILGELSPDVVHTHQISALLYAGAAARWARLPLIVHTEHGREPYARRWKTRMLGRIAGRFAHTFFCLTEDMACAVRAARIVPQRKIRVIFNGIDTSQFMTPSDTLSVRASLGIPLDAAVIGTVGRLTEIKRQDVLLRAFAAVQRRFPSAHLLLVGDGPLRTDLERLAAALGVGGTVHFAGYRAATAPLLQAMTIFALTSRSEGMPQAAIEASVSGLPVVASRVGGLPELIEDGRTGILFAPGDDAALALALGDLLADEGRARRIGIAARESAVRRFDIGRMAGEYHRHFLHALGGAPRDAGRSAGNRRSKHGGLFDGENAVSLFASPFRRADAPYPAIENPRYASLDMWRGLACLMIVVLHAMDIVKCGDVAGQRLLHPTAAKVALALTRLGIGVPMFFVISGYCISATADSSRRKGHAARDFFKRRLRRIYPPFWAALILTIAIFAVAQRFPVVAGDGADPHLQIPQASALNAWQWLGNVTLTETWRLHIGGGPVAQFLGPAWSLCYEEQFYVVCGLIILFIPRRFFTGALGVSLVTLGTFALSAAFPAAQSRGFFFDGRWLMFAAGVLVYYCLNYRPSAGKARASMVLIAGIVGAKILRRFLVGHGVDLEDAVDDPYSWSVACLFALALLWLRPLDEWVGRSTLLVPLGLCGRMCYSLYLIHWPLVRVMGNGFYEAGMHDLLQRMTIAVPIMTVIAIAAGWMFHLLVERHFLNPPRTGLAAPAQAAPEHVPIAAGVAAPGSWNVESDPAAG